MNIKKILSPLLFKIIKRHRNATMNNRVLDKKRISLSKDEIRQCKDFWGKSYNKGKERCYELYKEFGIFDIRQMPNDFYSDVEKVLNPSAYSVFLQHKCNLKYFVPAENRPKTLVQNIDGHFLDVNDMIISRNDAIKIMLEAKEFIIKIAKNSGGGAGIKKIILNGNSEDIKTVEELINEYRKDFIVQKLIQQHEEIAKFNPDSVNSIRVLSMNINDRFSILSSFLRMGKKGNFVDNLSGPEGAILVGIKQNGEFHDFGIDKKYRRIYESPTGISLKGLKIDNFEEIKALISKLHQERFPFANLIGWDISIDKDNKPIVIEINLNSGEIEVHQVFNGPIFGDRTEEVLQYMKNNKLFLGLSLSGK